MGNITNLRELNENHQSETYWGKDRDTILEFGNAMLRQQSKYEAEITDLRNELENKPDLSMLTKQMNDLHTVIMSSPTNERKKSGATKKPTKKEKLAEILQKRKIDGLR